eukprot:1221514-Lingulodinium_polyedra.AAC.1
MCWLSAAAGHAGLGQPHKGLPGEPGVSWPPGSPCLAPASPPSPPACRLPLYPPGVGQLQQHFALVGPPEPGGLR